MIEILAPGCYRVTAAGKLIGYYNTLRRARLAMGVRS